MAFTLDPQTGKITFGVVSDGTHDAIARDIASEFGVSELFNENFVTPATWTTTDSGSLSVDTVSDELDFNLPTSTTVNSGIAHDLTTPISDTLWNLRFKLDLTTFTTNTDPTGQSIHVGIGDSDQTVFSNVAQDWIGFKIVTAGSTDSYQLVASDGVGPDTGGAVIATFTKTPSAEVLYVEIRRTSATGAEINLYADSNYTALIESVSGAISSTIVNLQYIKVMAKNVDGTGNGDIIGVIDDIQLWNTTSTPTITSQDWRLRFTLDITNVDDGGSATDKTLFFGLSDVDETVTSSVAHDALLLRAFTNTGGNTFHGLTPDAEAPRTKTADVTMATALAVDTFYVELKRDSASQYTVNFYTDNTFVTLLETKTQAGISGTDNLRYLKAFNDNVASASGAIDGSIDDIEYFDLSTATVNSQVFTIDAFIQQVNGKCGIPLTDLKAYWNFDESSGVLVNQAGAIGSVDSLGTSADGTVGAQIDRNQTGQVSDSYLFEGDKVDLATETQSGNTITIGSSVSQFNFMHTPNSVGTFNFWIKPISDTQGFADLFINQFNTSGNTGMNIAYVGQGDGTGIISVRPRAPSVELLNPVQTTATFPINQFTMVTVVWDETSGADIYFDGVFQESFSRTGTATSSDADFPLTIGARSQTQANVTFDGELDEVSAWSRKLTPAEINVLYALNNGGTALQEGNGGAFCFTVDAFVKGSGANHVCGDELLGEIVNRLNQDIDEGMPQGGGTTNGSIVGQLFTPTNDVLVRGFRYVAKRGAGITGRWNGVILSGVAGGTSPGTIIANADGVSGDSGEDSQFIVFWSTSFTNRRNLFTPSVLLTGGTEYLIGVQEVDSSGGCVTKASDNTSSPDVNGDWIESTHSGASARTWSVVNTEDWSFDIILDGSPLLACPEVDAQLVQINTFDATFTVDAILIGRALSPLKNFDNFVASTGTMSFSTQRDVAIEIPRVTTETHVKSIKTRISSLSFQGAVRMSIVAFPVPTTGNGSFGQIGSDSDSVAMSSLGGSLVTHTFTFPEPIVLQPGVRYGIAFVDQIQNSPGMNYGVVESSEKDFTGLRHSVTSEWREPSTGTPQNFFIRRNQTRTWAVDIEILNDESGLVNFFVGGILIGREDTVAGFTLDWQYRENRIGDNFNTLPVVTLTDEPPNLDLDNTGGSGIGVGYAFKTFKKSDITGSFITITSSAVSGVARVAVYDGEYDRRDEEDFPLSTQHEPLATKGIGQLGVANLSTGTTTLTEPSINWAGSTEDEVTVFIWVENNARARITSIQIGSLAEYDMQNSLITLEQSGSGNTMDYGFLYANATSVPFMIHEFSIDACLGLFSGRRSLIGDLIIKTLQANPSGLTGLQIIAEVQTLRPNTKVSRIKNWIGYLRNQGIIEDDGSDPDWYETVWTLVP